MKSIIILSVTLLLAGCASSLAQGGYGSTGTVISAENYTILGKVEGRSEIPRLLYLFRNTSGDIYNAALDDLRENCIKEFGSLYSNNRGLINLTSDKYYEILVLLPIFSRQVVVVSADVVEYNK